MMDSNSSKIDLIKHFLCQLRMYSLLQVRGTVATGRIERGVINCDDPVEIIGMGAEKMNLLVLVLRCLENSRQR